MIKLTNDNLNNPITDWRNWTPPKQSYHWKAGRSAMELARAWFTSATPQCPPEIKALLSTSSYTEGIEFTEGYPEYVTVLPHGTKQNGRNHDLMLRGHTPDASAIVCVEAKVDELFDERIGKKWQKAKASGGDTKLPERIEVLLEIVFGANAKPNEQPWSDLRYQLLTGIAGALIQAANEQAPLAVFVVHEFQTHSANADLLDVTAEDYARFVEALFSVSIISNDLLYGPLLIPTHEYLSRDVKLFVGKTSYKW